jgi:hypothetical protein
MFCNTPLNPLWWGSNHRFNHQLIIFTNTFLSVVGGIFMIALALSIFLNNALLFFTVFEKIGIFFVLLFVTYAPNLSVFLVDYFTHKEFKK